MSTEMEMALQTFVAESRDLLQEFEDGLLDIENGAHVGSKIDAIFRAVHTIKGSAGLFGLDGIVEFTHVVESVLDRIRDGLVPASRAAIAALLPCRDHMGALIDAVAAGRHEFTPKQQADGEVLLLALQPLLGESTGGESRTMQSVRTDDPKEIAGAAIWHISLRFGTDTLREGMDPLSFLRFLGTLGEFVRVTTVTDVLPEAEPMDPESCYLGFEIDFETAADRAAIENVFEFVRDNSLIYTLAPQSPAADCIDLIRKLPEDERRLGDILVAGGWLSGAELEAGLNGSLAVTSAPLAPTPVEAPRLQAVPKAEPALDRRETDKSPGTQPTLRVDAARLDKLIDQIGELVIAGAGASLRASKTGDTALMEANGEIMRLVEAVRDSALQLRMVQIGTTFSRFQRVVRDISQELGKEIELVISGGDTEIDKSIVEKIGDPLMHLVRNAIDHGIEPVATRLERGKPARGTLRLNAFHESGSIVIEVSDDGGGLNRDRILAKAVERGLIEAGREPSDQEVYDLIFAPGFSTAPKVTNLSGRGVGMDVVKRNIQALRGLIEVKTQEGAGTTMRIHLPLTLAIIDGFMVGVGDSTFVVPLEQVVECIEVTAETGLNARDYINLRGEVLPIIRLRSQFTIDAEPVKRENIVVVECAGIKSGLIVDRLFGEFQTVIKPLGKLFSFVQGISGSTILGSGEVALILDIPALIQRVSRFDRTVREAA